MRLQLQEVVKTTGNSFAAAVQGLVNHRCDMALFGRQVAVARALGEAVFVPGGRDADNLHRYAQVPDHFADDGQLLEILLAEYREVRLHDVEQFRHHGGHTVEVAGSTAAAEGVRQVGHPHLGLGGHALGVNFRDFGCVQHLHALAEKLFLVRRHGAGIGIEVFVGAELQGIHENTDHHHVAQRSRLAHEIEVTLVQVAHRWNKGNALAALAKALKGRL